MPELHGSGTPNYMGDMIEFITASSANLTAQNRVAALSDEGVLILQQRMVFTQTRLLLPLDRFHSQMAPTFIELELQEEWTEEALASATADSDTVTVTDEAVKQYQSWLDEDNVERREALKIVREHSRIRREARQHYTSLYK
ncbi:hypothetical protein [Streptomyces zinciresistens]|uniref:hypothetical protein n=1 Tax=Streptomyces zinciresistens TaxID=1073330 RepID=UPI001112573E|nr:hypothetical protein [Streptomyces zinciresistens]